MTTAPRPMRARLRTAWKATCGSSAQAWTQRSPPERSGRARRRAAAGSGRSAAAGARPGRSGRAVLVEQRRPEAERHRERGGGRPTASPVSCGGSEQRCRCRARPARRAVIRAAASVHARSRSRRSARARPDDVEGGEVQAVLGRRDDARLVRAVEGDAAARRRRVGASAPATVRAAARRRAPPARRRPPRPRNRRRSRRAVASALRAGGHLRERLGERVDGLAELAPLRPWRRSS